MSILVVEDNPIAAKVISGMLQKNGFEVILVGTVQAGIDILQREETVTAAIVDIVLPGQEGFDLVEWVRTSSMWAYLPVVICSGRSDADTVQRLSKMGCRHYVLKPHTEQDLMNKLQAAVADSPFPGEAGPQVMRRLGLDVTLYREIASLFSAALEERLALLEAEFADVAKEEVVADLRDVMEGAMVFESRKLQDMVREFPKAAEGVSVVVPRAAWQEFQGEARSVIQRVRPPGRVAAA